MRKPYHTIDDVLHSPWAAVGPPAKSVNDRVLRSTKLEDSIYSDLRTGDGGLDQIEQAAEKQLSSFPALSRDIFQSFMRKLQHHPSIVSNFFRHPLLSYLYL